jgi:hypothetical protein
MGSNRRNDGLIGQGGHPTCHSSSRSKMDVLPSRICSLKLVVTWIFRIIMGTHVRPTNRRPNLGRGFTRKKKPSISRQLLFVALVGIFIFCQGYRQKKNRTCLPSQIEGCQHIGSGHRITCQSKHRYTPIDSRSFTHPSYPMGSPPSPYVSPSPVPPSVCKSFGYSILTFGLS